MDILLPRVHTDLMYVIHPNMGHLCMYKQYHKAGYTPTCMSTNYGAAVGDRDLVAIINDF